MWATCIHSGAAALLFLFLRCSLDLALARHVAVHNRCFSLFASCSAEPPCFRGAPAPDLFLFLSSPALPPGCCCCCCCCCSAATAAAEAATAAAAAPSALTGAAAGCTGPTSSRGGSAGPIARRTGSWRGGPTAPAPADWLGAASGISAPSAGTGTAAAAGTIRAAGAVAGTRWASCNSGKPTLASSACFASPSATACLKRSASSSSQRMWRLCATAHSSLALPPWKHFSAR